MPTPTAATEGLDSLLEDILEGELQLPEFQRPYEWKKKDQEALVESLLLLHPIGSMMILELKQKSPLFAWTKLSESVIPDEKLFQTRESEINAGGTVSATPPKRVILDGQQRMTTILHIFRGVSDKVWYLDCEAILKKWNKDSRPSTNEELLEWTDSGEFVIKDYLKIGKRGKTPPKNQFTNASFRFPLEMFTSKTEYMDCIQDFKNWIADEKSDKEARVKGAKSMKKGQSKASLQDEINELDNKGNIVRVLNYLSSNFDSQRVPVTTLNSKFSITSVCKIFTVTNQAGLKLGSFDLVVAAVYAEGVRLKRDYEELLESNELTKIVDNDDRTWVLQSLALVNNLSPNTNGLPRVIKGHHITKDLQPVLISFENTCKILQNELHVPIMEKGKPAVAYDRILPPLCAVEHQKTIRVKGDLKLTNDRIRKIKSWYYSAAVSKRYSTHSESRQISDKTDVINWFDKDFQKDMPLWIKTENPVALHGTGSGSEASLVLTILNSNNPRDILNGKQCKLGSKDPVDVHHIFPKAAMREKLMTDRGIKSKQDANKILREDEFFINSMMNKMLISSSTNRDYISDKIPSEYIASIIGDGVSEDQLKKRLLDSFIDDDCYKALVDDDYEKFVNLRSKVIEKHINDVIGHNVFK